MRIIAGKYKGIPLKTPKGQNTRPTPSRLRETLFNIIQHKIAGSTFLDLFAGSGIMGFEAISRGANSATLIDSDYHSVQTIKKNIMHLNVKDQVQIVKDDVIHTLERYAKQSKQFDVIYADPPYQTEVEYRGNTQLLSMLVLQMVDANEILKKGGLVFIEEGKEMPIDSTHLKHLTFNRTKKCGRATLHQFSEPSYI